MSRGFVIGIGALPNAGKSELCGQLVELGADYMHIGSIVRTTAELQGFKPADSSREAYLPFWRDYAKRHGQAWLSKLAFEHAEETGNIVALDGVRILADAKEIARSQTGAMTWLEADLESVAVRAVARARSDDLGFTVEEYMAKMQSDLDGSGSFSMGAIRDASEIFLVPVPEIGDPNTRAQYNNSVARHLLDVCGLQPAQ